MIIRAEQPGDAAAVHAVVLAAFGRPAEADLVTALAADGDVAISLLAEMDGAIVGHVLFSPVAAPFRALALAPVGVAPAHQRRGIATALIREGIDQARRAGWAAVFVLGDPAYYGRFGFDAALANGFVTPYAGRYFQALSLIGVLPADAGELRHAPAFQALGG